MKLFYKYFLIPVLIVIAAVASFSQTIKTGTTAAQVLKFNVGPRAINWNKTY